MPLKYLPLESDRFLLDLLALYRHLDRQARTFGWALDPESRDLLAQYEAEAARRGLGATPERDYALRDEAGCGIPLVGFVKLAVA